MIEKLNPLIFNGGSSFANVMAKCKPFKGHWNGKDYFIKPESAEYLVNGAYGSIFKVQVYVLKYTKSGEVFALKPKTMVAKLNKDDQVSNNETEILAALHQGKKRKGINVWYQTLTLPAPKVGNDSIGNGEMKQWIILKYYDQGDFCKIIKSLNNAPYSPLEREQKVIPVVIDLLEGLKGLLDVNVSNVDLKPANAFLYKSAALGDHGGAQQIPLTVTFENLQEIMNLEKLPLTPIYHAPAAHSVFAEFPLALSKCSQRAKNLNEAGEREIAKGNLEEGQIKIGESYQHLREAQQLLDRYHALIKTTELNLMGGIVSSLLLSYTPLTSNDPRDAHGIPHKLTPFKLDLKNSLESFGLDKRWEIVFKGLFSEVPSFQDLANFYQNGEEITQVLVDEKRYSVPFIRHDINPSKIEELISVLDAMKYDICENENFYTPLSSFPTPISDL